MLPSGPGSTLAISLLSSEKCIMGGRGPARRRLTVRWL